MTEMINKTCKTILADCCGGIILPDEEYTHDATFNFHIGKNRCKEIKTFDIKKSLVEQALKLCYAIEELPASEQQTKISIMASDLSRNIEGM